MQTAGFAPGVEDFEYRGTFQAMKMIVANEGFMALYRGLSINFLKVVPSVGISFTVYEYMKGMLSRRAGLVA